MTINFESSWSWNRVSVSVSLYSKLVETLHDYVWEPEEDEDA